VSTGEACPLPGISTRDRRGEGRYVNCRGFDADLNSTTFGGLRLPPTNNASPFGGYRAVDHGLHPDRVGGRPHRDQSNLPSQDAEALGCTIEIHPKTAPQNGAPFAEGNVGTGYEPLRQNPVFDVALPLAAASAAQGSQPNPT